MSDELGEWIYFLLIEERDEIVAETTHFRVSIHKLLFNVALLAHFLHIITAAESLKLRSRFGIGSLSGQFLKNENNESAFIMTFRRTLFATSMKQNRYLVYLEHNI